MKTKSQVPSDKTSTARAQTKDMVGVLAHFAAGATLGSGLIISGMTDARRAGAFFDVRRIADGTWDPTLGVVFFSGLSVNALAYQLLVRNMKRPLLANRFQIPTNTNIDAKLIGGSALFGVGWAVTGGCPGPLLVSASTGLPASLVALSGMLLGAGIQRSTSGHRNAFTIAALTAAGALTAARLDAFPLGAILRDSSALNPLYVSGALGGGLIGAAAAFLAVTEGRVLGVSGITGGLLTSKADNAPKRLAFLVGLAAAAKTVGAMIPNHIVAPPTGATVVTMLAGMLVGVGTQMGSGCTSGHGICGLARFSRRSIAAVATFMGFNALVSSFMP